MKNADHQKKSQRLEQLNNTTFIILLIIVFCLQVAKLVGVTLSTTTANLIKVQNQHPALFLFCGDY
jgi:hypothetical protein